MGSIMRLVWIAIALLSLSACEAFETARPSSLPQAENARVYFNHNPDASYTDPYREFERPGDNLEAVLIEAIANADTRLDIAVQELRLPLVARAIAARHRDGLPVRVIIENTYSRPWSSFTPEEVSAMDPRDRDAYEEARALIDLNGDLLISPEEAAERDALVILRDAGVPLIDDTADDSAGSGLMHHKFLVADERIVVTGSANWTTSGIHGDFGSPSSLGNANNLLRLDSPAIARVFTEEFDLMWGDGPGGAPDSRFGLSKPERDTVELPLGEGTIAIHFSPASPTLPFPKSSNGAIAAALSKATASIDLALFVFSDQQIVDVIGDRANSGVAVSASFDPSFAFRYYSEALDMLGVALPLDCAYEDNNRPWNRASDRIGVPKLPPGDKLHHKFALIDNRVVITGSHNWSPAANYNNDETLLILDHPIVAAHYARERDRLFAGAELGLPAYVGDRIDRAEADCPVITTGDEPVGPVNLNRATIEELEALPGIGPALAARIVAERQNGPYASPDDLERVSGIGPATVADLRDRVTW